MRSALGQIPISLKKLDRLKPKKEIQPIVRASLQQQFKRVFVSKLRSQLSLAPGSKIIRNFGIAHDRIILQQCERGHLLTQ